ncbi:MAG: hypothetical protein JW760_07580 [Spirochaetales bacterium]|nr:hypothetical protein [Spirochaetales bacterium]
MDTGETAKELVRKIKILFAVLAAANGGVFLLIFFLHKKELSPSLTPEVLRPLGIGLLIATVCFSVAVSILLRTFFVSKALKSRKFDLWQYHSLQMKLVIFPMIGVLPAALGYLFRLPKLYLYGSMIVALYGVYSALPSLKKIRGELNYFQKRCS